MHMNWTCLVLQNFVPFWYLTRLEVEASADKWLILLLILR
jgi:hypothetical protein